MRKAFILCTVIFVSLLTGCTTIVQPQERFFKKNVSVQDNEVIPEQISYQDNTEKLSETYQRSHGMLESGSEYAVRDHKPVSKYILQKEYPNVIAIHGSYNSNKIALTFDDGPDPRFTPKVLDVLKKHNAKATFFVIGARAAAHQELLKRIHNEGHAIGNHTYWHPDLEKVGIGRLDWGIKETAKVIEETIGYNTRLFRPPYGSLNEETTKYLKKRNYSAIMWSVDSSDWMSLSSEQVQKNVLSNIHPGAVVLMHDGGHWTQDLSGMVNALDIIIKKLKKDGMEFVTVPELFNIPERKWD